MIAGGALALGVLTSAAWAQQALTGRGAAIAAPILSAWDQTQKDFTVGFSSSTALDGVGAAFDRSADFGVNDYPIEQKVLREARVVQAPMLIGSVALVVNLKEATSPVKLDGAILSGIFSSRIMYWNDPAIVALNPALAKVAKPIAPMVRIDESGLTRSFTEYLSQVDNAWRMSPGIVYQLKFRTAVYKQGEVGVIHGVRTIDGAIAFVDAASAARVGLTFAQVKNPRGEFVTPTPAATEAAIRTVNWAQAFNGNTNTFDLILNNANAIGAWPINYTIYALIPRGDRKKETAMRAFFATGMRDVEASTKLGYVSLPATAISLIETQQLK